MPSKNIIAAQKATYGEIVRKDCYKINDFPNNCFDVIVDIGANVGIFTNYIHMRNNKALILAYEPCKECFDYLLESTDHMDNIKCFNRALGDGGKLLFKDIGHLACNQFLKEEETSHSTYTVSSDLLSDIFVDNNLGVPRCLLKIDCEGGERCLLEDDDSIDIIKEVKLFCLEVHFPPLYKNSKYFERFKSFPEWEVWNDWIYSNFQKTHKILYHCSDGKRRGAGVYVLTKEQG